MCVLQVKKKWSIRSISFSKKDKQKPHKKEQNGEPEKVPEEVGFFYNFYVMIQRLSFNYYF